MKTINTFYFGEVTLQECFNYVDGKHIVVIDASERVIAKIYGYTLNDIDEDVITDNLI